MKTSFVAEISSNHNQNLERCLTFIQASSDIGCSAAKFQIFKINELFAPQILAKSEKHRMRSEWELPLAFIPELAAKSKEVGLKFACTPFYLKAVEELEPYVDFYKVASYELLWDELLRECALTGKQVVLSTGMANLDEVSRAVNTLKESGCADLILLHCVSGYPTPIEQCNLMAIETLKNEFNCKVGWSDHSVEPTVIHRAVNKWGAEMIEFHLDLEGHGVEYEVGHCWLPEEIEAVIKGIGIGISADGNGEKRPAESELADRDWRTDPNDGLRPIMKIRESWEKRG